MTFGLEVYGMGDDLVGQRVEVFWDEVGDWFSGVVRDAADRKYFVVYDDGDEQWESVDRRQIQRLHKPSTVPTNGIGTSKAEILQPPASSQSSSEEQDDEEDQNDVLTTPSKNAGAAQSVQPQLETAPASRLTVLPIATNSDQTAEVISDGDVSSDDSSDVPDLHELARVTTTCSAMQSTAGKLSNCTRARLEGSVLSASHLPRFDDRADMNAFVKVAFVEAGASDNPMLRSKRILHTTEVVSASRNPVWGFEFSNQEPSFFMDVIPPMASITARSSRVFSSIRPCWEALRGDLLFTLYHAKVDEGSNHLVAQALLSLQTIVLSSATEDLLPRQLPLQTPKGSPLLNCELAVSIRLLPLGWLEAETNPLSQKPLRKQTKARKKNSIVSVQRPFDTHKRVSSIRSSRSIQGPRRRTQQAVSQKHLSSAQVNRRRNDLVIQKQNEAMQRRLLANGNRQHRLFKDQIQRARVAPPSSSRASSNINRKKQQVQISIENRNLAKRIAEQKLRVQSRAKRFDDDDEKESRLFILQHNRQESQLMYKQQSELVEQMTALSNDVADLKSINSRLTKEAKYLQTSIERMQRLKSALVKSTAGAGTERSLAASKVTLPTSFPGRLSHHHQGPQAGADVTSSKEKEQLTQQLGKLEKEVEDLSATKTQLATEFEECNRQHVAAFEALEVQQADWNALRHREKPQQEELSKIQEQIRLLQVEIQVLQQKVASQQQAASTRSQRPPKLAQVVQKLQQKQEKIDMLKVQEAQWQDQVEALREQNARRMPQLRQQIQQMQQILFLCEKEKST